MPSNRIGISVNLPKGDQYDILLVSTPDFPVGKLSFKFEATPRKIAGIQKVAQTFMRILFTTKGSDLVYSQMGTSFSELTMGSNRSTSDSVFLAQITASVKDAESQTKMILNASGKDLSAQLASISVLGLTAEKDAVTMYLQMVTLAGEQASVAIPFPQLDLRTFNG